MLFKDLIKTAKYKSADVIEFINPNGEEIKVNNLDDKTLLNTKVIRHILSHGLMEVTLDI